MILLEVSPPIILLQRVATSEMIITFIRISSSKPGITRCRKRPCARVALPLLQQADERGKLVEKFFNESVAKFSPLTPANAATKWRLFHDCVNAYNDMNNECTVDMGNNEPTLSEKHYGQPLNSIPTVGGRWGRG